MEEESTLIPHVMCQLSTQMVAASQLGYGYGTLVKESGKLVFNIEDNPTYRGMVRKRTGYIEIEDVAEVELTTLSYSRINIIAVKRHMHSPLYFRYCTSFGNLPFFGNASTINQQIFTLCEASITDKENNEYCQRERAIICAIEEGCGRFNKNIEFTVVDRERYDALLLMHSILRKLQPTDEIGLFALLVEQGFDLTKPIPGWVNETTFDTTLLHFVVKRQLRSIVAYLLQNGADVNQKSMGKTPLHVACSTKNVLLCETLLSYGANVNDENSYRDTPLSISILKQDIDGVRYLLEHGAKVTFEHLEEAVKTEKLPLVKCLMEKLVMSNEEDIGLRLTAVLEACSTMCNEDIKEYFVSKGATIHERSCIIQ